MTLGGVLSILNQVPFVVMNVLFKAYRIQGSLFDWMMSSLIDRCQLFKIKGAISSELQVSSGVV